MKYHFPGFVQDLLMRKHNVEIIDINDHNEIVSALVEALELLLSAQGQMEEKAIKMAKAALAKARGEGNEQG